MNKEGWKVLAIILMVIFFLEVVFIILAMLSVIEDDKITYECYYEVCEGYADVLYENNICYCFDIDADGGYSLAKTEVMK